MGGNPHLLESEMIKGVLEEQFFSDFGGDRDNKEESGTLETYGTEQKRKLVLTFVGHREGSTG